MPWTWYSGKACLLSGSEGDMILQVISQSAGNAYVIKFDIVGMTQGKIKLNNYEENYEFDSDGSYAVVGTAINSTLVFTGELDENGDLFNGCIDNVAVVQFGNLVEEACSPCINVKEEQDDCLLLLTVENTGNALNFDWSDLTLKARISAKFAKVEYETREESFDDNGGDYITTYFDGKKNRNLQVSAAPIYIHDFLFMAKGVDSLTINGTAYVIVNDGYPSIAWNKTFTEGTVELLVRKRNSKLNKTNCVG